MRISFHVLIFLIIFFSLNWAFSVKRVKFVCEVLRSRCLYFWCAISLNVNLANCHLSIVFSLSTFCAENISSVIFLHSVRLAHTCHSFVANCLTHYLYSSLILWYHLFSQALFMLNSFLVKSESRNSSHILPPF